MIATVTGVVLIVSSLTGGDPVSLITLVGVLFLAVAAARYSLAKHT